MYSIRNRCRLHSNFLALVLLILNCQMYMFQTREEKMEEMQFSTNRKIQFQSPNSVSVKEKYIYVVGVASNVLFFMQKFEMCATCQCKKYGLFRFGSEAHCIYFRMKRVTGFELQQMRFFIVSSERYSSCEI